MIGKKSISANFSLNFSLLVVIVVRSSPSVNCLVDMLPKSNKQDIGDIILAATEGNENAVDQLIRNGAAIDATNEFGETALNIAARHGRSTMVQLLLSNKAKIDAKDSSDFTPLQTSARFGHSEIVGLLCQSRAELINQEGAYALKLAVQNGHVTVVEVLLNRGVNIEAQLMDGKSALVIAAENGYLDIVKLLCVKGAKLDAKGKDNISALGWAEKKKHMEVAKYLKTWSAKSATAQPAGSSGWYPGKYFRKLVSGGFKKDVNFHDIYPQEDLDDGFKAPDNIKGALRSSKKAFMAMENGDWKKAKEEVFMNGSYLSGLELKKQHGGEATALCIAAQEGHLRAVEVLVNNKAAIEAKDNVGFTPLCTAALNGHFNVIEFLCQNRANVEAKTKSGYTPLLISTYLGHDEVIALLCEKGANVEARTKDGATALFLAARKGHINAIKILAYWKAAIETVNNVGTTPLIAAAEQGHLEAVQMLCKLGANVDAQDKRSHSVWKMTGHKVNALYWAEQGNHWKVAQFLTAWPQKKVLISIPTPIIPQREKTVIELYPELSDFLCSIINETVNPSAPVFQQRVIVSRCIDRFVANGYKDEKSIVDACECINNDDLSLSTAIVQTDIVNSIYKAIISMRKQAELAPPQTPSVNDPQSSSLRLVIRTDNVIVGNGNSYILDGVFTGGYHRFVNHNVKVKAVEKSNEQLLAWELEVLHKLVVQLNCKRFVKPLHDSLIPCKDFSGLIIIPADVAKIKDNGVAMVMEKGIITLQDHIANHRERLSFGDFVQIIYSLVDMVKEAHDNKFVLMDIKGANVMQFETDVGLFTWKGIDLDSCLPVGTPLSKSDPIMTTVHFMAPELLSRDQHSDLTAMLSMDIWSLGVLVFDVLVNQQQQTFWHLLGIHCEEGIIEEIKSGQFTQEKVDQLIDKYFPDTSYRTFLQRMLNIDPLKRSTVDELRNAALLRAGPSVPLGNGYRVT
eukprot:gene24535-32997_t